MTDSETFCVMPFIGRFQNLNGTSHFCCYGTTPIDFDSDEANRLRQKVYNGEKIGHCHHCYNLESKNIVSARIVENAMWMKDPEIIEYLNNWNKDNTNIYFYDIRYDNKCNLACIMCNPMNSSLWEKELGIESPKHKLKFKIEDALKSKRILMAGGEPLIIDDCIELLHKVSEMDVQPEVIIITNLTRINDNIKGYLKKIKNLTLAISIDAYGKVNEYHRWPLKWDKLVENIKWVRTLGCNIQFNTVVDAISIFSVDRLIEIEDLFDSWSLLILTKPSALQVSNLPEHIKQDILKRFENIKRSKFYNTNEKFTSEVDGIANKLMMHGNTELLINYITEIDNRRNLNHADYLGVNLHL
jgi:MoaA/NifB/PqqE/SkfB family radical SAM enzyme